MRRRCSVIAQPKLLLRIHLSPLKMSGAAIDMRLPSRRTNILDTAWRLVVEDLVDLFKRLAGRLGEEEEDMHEHAEAEDSEEEIDFPADVLECWGYEVAKCEVELDFVLEQQNLE